MTRSNAARFALLIVLAGFGCDRSDPGAAAGTTRPTTNAAADPAADATPPDADPAVADTRDPDRKAPLTDARRRALEVEYWTAARRNQPARLPADQMAAVEAIRKAHPIPKGSYRGTAEETASDKADVELNDLIRATLTPAQVAEAADHVERTRPTVKQACASGLHQIGLAILLYQQDNHNQYPPDLGAVAAEEQLWLQGFLCPGTDHVVPPEVKTMSPEQRAAWVNANTDYVYLRPAGRPDARRVLCYDKDENHGGTGLTLLYADGHAAFVPMAKARRDVAASERAAKR